MLKTIILETLKSIKIGTLERGNIDTWNSLVQIIRNSANIDQEVYKKAKILFDQRNTASWQAMRDELENFIIQNEKYLD